MILSYILLLISALPDGFWVDDHSTTGFSKPFLSGQWRGWYKWGHQYYILCVGVVHAPADDSWCQVRPRRIFIRNIIDYGTE